jgi:hypothetical protein
VLWAVGGPSDPGRSLPVRTGDGIPESPASPFRQSPSLSLSRIAGRGGLGSLPPASGLPAGLRSTPAACPPASLRDLPSSPARRPHGLAPRHLQGFSLSLPRPFLLPPATTQGFLDRSFSCPCPSFLSSLGIRRERVLGHLPREISRVLSRHELGFMTFSSFNKTQASIRSNATANLSDHNTRYAT